MTDFLLYLSGLLVSAAQTPYLDGYFFGTVTICCTVIATAVVIHAVYEIGSMFDSQ